MKVTARGSVVVVVNLEGDERFEVTATYGRHRRPVMVDTVRCTASVSHGYAIVAGRRINKDGSVGSLRAAHISVPFDRLPEPIRQAVLEAYTTAALAVPDSVPWR